jgi:hypothetical protein
MLSNLAPGGVDDEIADLRLHYLMPESGGEPCRLPPKGCLFSIIGAIADDAKNQGVQILRFRLGDPPYFDPASP